MPESFGLQVHKSELVFVEKEQMDREYSFKFDLAI